MLEAFKELVGGGIIVAAYYICLTVAKLIVTNFICRHPELSDDKVKSITRMMSKDKFHI